MVFKINWHWIVFFLPVSWDTSVSEMESWFPWLLSLGFILFKLVIIITDALTVVCGTVVRGKKHRTQEEEGALVPHASLVWIKLCDFEQVICLCCFIFSSSFKWGWWTTWPPLMLHICLCFHTCLVMRAASSCTFIGKGLETIFLILGSRNSRLFSSEDL